MRKKSPTLVCRLSTPLTTKTLERVVPACVLPCAQVLAAMVVAAAGLELAHNRVPPQIVERRLLHDEARRSAANITQSDAIRSVNL
jgi:hypothetical protein